eukprot:CAMPEP_0168368218 /NCGR_PEP_ID=MMETSP0228-20121227/6139_1 /TAXON_ID=133427 /ORGANISM="Protoceratium reticulatum, Strain CCCM 535 (=CCMP 1889)" /LENGTH=95 /DNA_ID=CAMNT_0008381061 /DNA_START=310 /DNA_END=594 /DNA_ORIENTATION=+
MTRLHKSFNRRLCAAGMSVFDVSRWFNPKMPLNAAGTATERGLRRLLSIHRMLGYGPCPEGCCRCADCPSIARRHNTEPLQQLCAMQPTPGAVEG